MQHLRPRRAVSLAEGKQLAEENGFLFSETSAKDGTGVQNVFRATAEEVNRRIADGRITLGKHVQCPR